MPTTKEEVLARVKKENIHYIKLQFTDILGMIKSVEIPVSQVERALNGEVMFDGSSIEGFVRIEESDMLLKPDFRTFRVLRWNGQEASDLQARLICDIYRPDGSPFEGCPRLALKRVIGEIEKLGLMPYAGPEVEFFLFRRNELGEATTQTQDVASYFDQTPVDLGEMARRKMVNFLESLEYEVEASHHEVAPGQHEIDFKYEDALLAADYVLTFRFVVKRIAQDCGLYATFMPKPKMGINGSGMHTHLSLFKGEENVFFDPKGKMQLSDLAFKFAAGLLAHSRGISAITNPLINSYKRLVPGYEAPTHIAWSEKNRSPLVRIPAARGKGTRLELRMPDPATNPYLAFAVMLAAGLDGIKKNMTPPEPITKNVFEMTHAEREKYRISSLPANLSEALDELEKDAVIRSALGEHIINHFLEAKRHEWHEYIAAVHPWELERYLANY